MDTFFIMLRKTIIATVVLFFAFAFTYVPQDWNQIEAAHAGSVAGTGGALEITQWAQFAQDAAYQVADLAKATLNIAQNTITATMTGNMWVKENVLDGIAWVAAKAFVQAMVDSLVDWIQSGFEGRPAFVEDLGGFLLEAADVAAGQYIESLGGLGSFICSPFQLDIQLALRIKYDEIIRSNGERPISTCTLTGIAGNIEDFLSGLPGSFDQGGTTDGWENWFQITSNPEMYTPYGAYLTAEGGMRASLINAKGEEMKILEFGDGFLSGTLCETVHGAGSSKDDCFINKPGKFIQESLTFNTDSGRQSLVTADEINEIIAALLQQLATRVLTGAAGLLG